MLSDQTCIGDMKWANLKTQAMLYTAKYQTWFVSNLMIFLLFISLFNIWKSNKAGFKSIYYVRLNAIYAKMTSKLQ